VKKSRTPFFLKEILSREEGFTKTYSAAAGPASAGWISEERIQVFGFSGSIRIPQEVFLDKAGRIRLGSDVTSW
jgi:hypothetical protein